MEIPPVNASYAITYDPMKGKVMEYKQIIITVNGNQQTQTVYTYNKHGNLIETVIKNHEIASV